MRIISMRKFASFEQILTLDNKTYRMVFSWNTRGKFWSLDFYNGDELILSGVKLVLNYDLLSQQVIPDFLKGQLYVIDETGNKKRVAFDDFTNVRDLKLIYVEEETLDLI